MSGGEKKFFCGDCEKGWVKKSAYDKHFDLKFVKSSYDHQGGKEVSNVCYKQKLRIFGGTLDEARAAKAIKHQMSLGIDREAPREY